ncbi:Na(+)-translocating NADH-quinone reductase subunit F [Haloflavibacter putidus]|uniref:Na(+)-translocating NADH-quinone reductase subunit F n=1 Tax=Haloflavibacter putidus TaxID=2576776 RepID=A0A507ZKI1_9FLAO|nr:Na(+)-translocating NADH-quinone reductase subunit F [Haloflavibacter putidus]TQD37719.1 Na(+)-translocating NADH-quinone reductase subunit F [Haloflavibacter putidus]
MANLSKQELHNLAMNIVGKDLEDKGYEFLGVNSAFKKDPQFVALKDKKLHFVIVRAITYPDNPTDYDVIFMESIKTHAEKFNAKTFYAGVGIANSTDYEKPVSKEEDYVINYKGFKQI